MDKVLEGDLGHFVVPDILSLLHMGIRTGVLVLERDAEETKLFVREGRPVFAVTTRADLRLGALLIRTGRITDDVLTRTLNRQQSGLRLGEVLLAEGILTAQELASFLKVQVSEVIFSTFSWHVGRFVFYDEVEPPAAVVTLEMDLQNLIMEGARRMDERDRLTELFPDRNVAVEVMANPERVKASVTLTPEEWQVFFLVDGRRTISEICRSVSNPDELSTLRVLHRLMVAKFIALLSAQGEQAPPPLDPPSVMDMGDRAGTQLFADDKTPAPSAQYSVEFQQAPKRPEDDTHEIVNPLAVGYQQGAKQVQISRLILVKDGQETSLPLTKDSYTMGRHRNNDIVISNPKVSSFHARLDRTPQGFMLVDLKSRNGCWLNGQKVESGVLKTGDELRLGPARLTFKVDYVTPVS
jgi:hypothetical protein